MEYRAYTACIICCIFLQPYIRKKELRKSYQIEEVAPKIELSDNYIERAVDLNDYFNSSTGWDDDTDWNYAGLEDEEVLRRVMNDENVSIVGISCYMSNNDKSIELAKRIRAMKP